MKYKTIPFVFECVTDNDSVQYVIVRYSDGRIFDVCKTLADASCEVVDFLDDEVFVDKNNES